MKALAPRFVTMKIAAVIMAVALSPEAARACAVCYGEPDSPAARGLTWAIIALGLIVGMVLSGVILFFVQANRSAAQLTETGVEEIS